MTRLLLVDDHPAVRRAVHEALSEAFADLVVAEAATGAEALRLVQGEAWDLVLLDLSLPDRGGVEVLRDIKRQRPELPVLVLSMHAQAPYAPRLAQVGAAGFVEKGCAPAELSNAVRAALAPALEGRS